MTNRVVIGKYLSGAYGLKTSLPGYSALSDDENDSEKISFNSNWTDLVKPLQLGVVSSPGTDFGGVSVGYTYPGYFPFVDMRPIKSGLITDGDMGAPAALPSSRTQGNTCSLNISSPGIMTISFPSSTVSLVFYVMFKDYGI